MFLNKIRKLFVSRQQTFPARANGETNICVSNNVSSFARAFTSRHEEQSQNETHKTASPSFKLKEKEKHSQPTRHTDSLADVSIWKRIKYFPSS